MSGNRVRGLISTHFQECCIQYVKLIRRFAWRGKQLPVWKERSAQNTQPHTHCRSKYGERRPIANEIRAKTTGKTRQSGTVHSTVHTVHHSKGWRTLSAATAHPSAFLSNNMLLQLLWSSGLPWVKYRLLMIVLQERNLFECTIYTKGEKKK